MTSVGLDVWDRAIQTSNLWLKELSEELRWEDRRDTYQALRAVLHALRDRLTPDEAADLAAQLPLLIKGTFYDGWKPGKTPVKVRDRQGFLQMVERPLQRSKPEANPVRITGAVFGLLERKVSEGEIEDVQRMLPEEIRDLWPEVGAGPGDGS